MADHAREHTTEPIDIPAGIADLAQSHGWARDTVGESGDAFYRLRSPEGETDLYLKHGRGPHAADLAGEMVRLLWFGSHLPMPAVRQFACSPDEAWLLLTALHGNTVYQVLEANPGGRDGVVDALPAFLSRLHSISVETCRSIAITASGSTRPAGVWMQGSSTSTTSLTAAAAGPPVRSLTR